MKKIFFILFIIALLSCVNNYTVNIPVDNHDWSNAVEKRIEGVIESCKDGYICLLSNWESRSRASNYVYGQFYSELSENIHKIAIVSGKVLKGPSPWINYILVEEIIEISKDKVEL